MFATAGQRARRAREKFGLPATTPVVMTSPAGGFVNKHHNTQAAAELSIRERIMAHLDLDPQRMIVDGPCAVTFDVANVRFIPLNDQNTDFADPLYVDRATTILRWWDSGNRSNVTCRMWFTTADGRWALRDTARRVLFMRSKFAVGLEDHIVGLGGHHQDPAPDRGA